MPCGGDSIIESVQLVGLYLWMHDPARRAVTNSGTCDSSRHRVGGAVAFWRNCDMSSSRTRDRSRLDV